MNKVVFLGGLLIASLALAEEQSTTVAAPGSTATTAPVAASSGVVGSADLRPSWTPLLGGFRTENNLQLGYQFNPDLSLKAVYDVDLKEKANGDLDSVSNNLYARTDVKNIAEVGAFKVSYVNRLYAPVNTAKRDAGMITAMRNYFNFNTQLSENVSLTMSVIPILHLYNKAGTAASGSPLVENRLAFAPQISLGKVTIAPLLWHSLVKHNGFSGASANNGTLSNYLEFDVDVTYAFTDKVAAGIGYYSDNLLSAMDNGEVRGVNITDGIKKGSPQLTLQVSL